MCFDYIVDYIGEPAEIQSRDLLAKKDCGASAPLSSSFQLVPIGDSESQRTCGKGPIQPATKVRPSGVAVCDTRAARHPSGMFSSTSEFGAFKWQVGRIHGNTGVFGHF
jgi:hypothetical protein